MAGAPGAPPCPPLAAVEAVHSPESSVLRVPHFQELGPEELLGKEEVQAGVAAANAKGDRELASKSSPGRSPTWAPLAPAGWGSLTLARRGSAVPTAARFPAGGASSVPHTVRPAPAAWGTLRPSSLRPPARDSGAPPGSWAASSLQGASHPPVPRLLGSLSPGRGAHWGPTRLPSGTRTSVTLTSVSRGWPPPRASVWRARVERDRGQGARAACGHQARHRPGLAPAEGPRPAGRPVQPPLPPAGLRAVQRINQAIRAGVAADTVKELRCPEAQLPPVHPCAPAVYQQELAVLQRQQQGVRPPPPARLGVSSQPGAAWGTRGQIRDLPCPRAWCDGQCPWAKTASHTHSLLQGACKAGVLTSVGG